MSKESISQKFCYLIEDARRIGVSTAGITFLKEEVEQYISLLEKERDDALAELAQTKQAGGLR